MPDLKPILDLANNLVGFVRLGDDGQPSTDVHWLSMDDILHAAVTIQHVRSYRLLFPTPKSEDAAA